MIIIFTEFVDARFVFCNARLQSNISPPTYFPSTLPYGLVGKNVETNSRNNMFSHASTGKTNNYVQVKWLHTARKQTSHTIATFLSINNCLTKKTKA